MNFEKLKNIEYDKYLEYAIMITIFLSTRSVYAHIPINLHFNIIFILLFTGLILIKLLKKKLNIIENKKIFIYIFVYYIYIIVFSLLNNIYDFSNFISTFLIMFPLIFIRYAADRDENIIRKDFIKLSNIISIVAFCSLIMYIIGPLTNIINPTNTVYLEWGNPRYIESYLNLQFVTQTANILGVNLIRNTSFFVEAPMYALNLLIALDIQLFINKKKQNYKVAILIISILSTYSATGIATATIMLIASAILNFIDGKDNKKINITKKIGVSLICVFLIVGSIYIYHERKNHTESYEIRIDDFKASFLSWKESPIIGIGHNQIEPIKQHMSSFRMHNTGLSNSVLVLLAQCGIYLSIFYLVPIIILLIHLWKERKKQCILFVLSIICLCVTTIFQYTIIMIWLLACMYAYIYRIYYFKEERNKKKIKMYVITHKKFIGPELEGYIPLQVGAEGKEKLGYLKDNTGENISSKNSNYCELTGLYWIWKNDKDNDIIGISHYRRYFTTDTMFKSNPINIDDINEILNSYDVILAKKEIYKQNVYEQYCSNSGFAKDLKLVKDIIQNKYSSKYSDSFDKVMNCNSISQFNMMITTKKIYNEYCEWLFEILFELEKNIDLKNYNDYQKRIYGFIAERLLNVWILANNDLKVKRLSIINTESSKKEKTKLQLRRIKNYIIFHKNKRRSINERN